LRQPGLHSKTLSQKKKKRGRGAKKEKEEEEGQGRISLKPGLFAEYHLLCLS
jgi:hypothetical protein